MCNHACHRNDPLGVQSSDSGPTYVGILRVRLHLGGCTILCYTIHVTWLDAFWQEVLKAQFFSPIAKRRWLGYATSCSRASRYTLQLVRDGVKTDLWFASAIVKAVPWACQLTNLKHTLLCLSSMGCG